MDRGKSIRTQILMAPFIALIGFLIVLVIVMIGLGIQKKNSQTAINNLVLLNKIREVDVGINSARYAEKDFLLHPKFEYVLLHHQILDKFYKDLKWLNAQELAPELQVKAKKWLTEVQTYAREFKDIEAEISQIGYTENSGLRGKIALSAEVVEHWLNNDETRKEFFKLRNVERLYILGQNEQFFEQWQAELEKIKTSIAKTQYTDEVREIIQTALSNYADAFFNLVDLDKDLRKDREKVETLSTQLSLEFSDELARYSTFTTEAATTGLEKNQIFAIYVFFVTLVVGLVVFWLSRRISAQITQPLMEVSETMVRLADGDLEAPIPASNYQQEINQVIGSVRVFRNAALERREARLQLSAANKQTQNIIRSMREALFETDAQGVIRMANPAAEKLLGIKAGELIGKKLQTFFGQTSEQGTQENLASIQSVLETACAVSGNCTEVINQSSQPVILLDTEGVIVAVNDSAASLTGYDPDELVQQNVVKLIPEDKREKHIEGMKNFRADSGGMATIDEGRTFSIVRKDGSFAQISLAVLAIGTEEHLGYMCVIQEASSANNTESSLQKLPEQISRDFGFLSEMDIQTNAASDTRHWVINNEGDHIPVNYSGALLRDSQQTVSGSIYVVRDISDQLLAEKELNQFKSTLERVASEIYMFDPENLKLFYANQAALEGVGMSADEICGKTPMDIMPKLNEAKFRARLQPLLDGETDSVRYETKETLENGNRTYEEVFIQLIHLDDQSPRFIAFVSDISARREAEGLLERFKATLDSTSDAVFMFKPDTLEFLFLNEEAKLQTGWDEADYNHKTPEDIIPVFSEARFRTLVAPLVYGTKRSVTVTTVGLNGNPAEVIVELFHPDNSDPWYAVTARDITERNKAESEIKKFKKTLDQSQDEIYMFYPDTLKLTYMNNMAKDITGVGEAGYIGLTFKDFADSFNRETFLERAKDLLEGRKRQINYNSINKIGRPVNISLQIIEAADSTKQFVLIASDISEQLAADKAKSEFIATVSHELRTPLTSIKGALGIIDAGVLGDIPPKMGDLVSMALKNSSRLERLINDILDMEKAEAGKMEYVFAPVDLSQVVEDSLSANKGYAEAHHVKFIAKGTESPAWISGDYDRLMQVLANLMSNAAKFSNENDEIKISIVPSADKVRLSVKDQGCGIPEEAQATIFDKFTQADSSDQRGKAGTGLGLSIVKMMVESHGGTIDFISDAENGTEFFVDFDLIETPCAESSQAA